MHIYASTQEYIFHVYSQMHAHAYVHACTRITLSVRTLTDTYIVLNELCVFIHLKVSHYLGKLYQ